MIAAETLSKFVADSKTSFTAARDAEPEWASGFYRVVKSDGHHETYTWCPSVGPLRAEDDLPEMVPWIGERRICPVEPVGADTGKIVVVAANERVELTHQIHRESLLDDRCAAALAAAARNGRSTKRHVGRRITGRLKAGNVVPGLRFFGHHVVPGVGGFDNDVYGPLNLDTYRRSCEEMARFGVTADTILCAALAEDRAKVVADYVRVYNADMPEPKRLPVPSVVSADDFNADPNTYYVTSRRDPRKPFVYQLREQTEFALLVDLNSSDALYRSEYKFGSTIRDCAIFGCPLAIVRVSTVCS